MPRQTIDFPDKSVFITPVTVHNSYINRGDHVGNSSYVELCNEASLRFFRNREVPEYTVGKQVLLNTEFSVKLVSEARHGDELNIEIGVDNFHQYGCDFIYRISQQQNATVVALARFSFLCFDYKQKKVVPAASGFAEFFNTGRD